MGKLAEKKAKQTPQEKTCFEITKLVPSTERGVVATVEVLVNRVVKLTGIKVLTDGFQHWQVVIPTMPVAQGLQPYFYAATPQAWAALERMIRDELCWEQQSWFHDGFPASYYIEAAND